MHAPVISIVTPSFNQGEFIEDTIKSVLSQSGDFFIDYIVVDGGSTDNSVTIIKQYDHLLKAGGWPILCRGIEYRWISERDKGQSHAVNKGWAIARGQIIGWLNSDDLLLPGSLNEIVKAFAKDKRATFVYGNGHLIEECGDLVTRFNVEKDEQGNYRRRFDTGKFGREELREMDYILQPTAFYSKKVLEKTGMLDETLHYCMDHDYWIRVSENFDFTFIDRDIAAARLHTKSKTMTRWTDVEREEVSIIRKHYGTVNPPTVFRYVKAVVMSRLKFPVSIVTPIFVDIYIDRIYTS